jgi:GH15 family glucan-1,4-alpha-glucosidase
MTNVPELRPKAEAVYTRIEDYALIGDCRTAALVGRDGSIDWLCWPRFDSPSLFARLLDARRGGHFSITPDGAYETRRRYRPDSNVLETEFVSPHGHARMTDAMVAVPQSYNTKMLMPQSMIVRRVEGIAGSVPLRVEFVPAPEYASASITLRRAGPGTVACKAGPRAELRLTSELEWRVEGRRAPPRSPCARVMQWRSCCRSR